VKGADVGEEYHTRRAMYHPSDRIPWLRNSCSLQYSGEVPHANRYLKFIFNSKIFLIYIESICKLVTLASIILS
jgi:hypothetical protein